MKDERVRFALSDSIATVTLCRPDRANAVDVETARQIHDAAVRCDAEEVRAVLLRAEGPLFCAGGDVKAFARAGEGLPQVLADLLEHLHAAIERFSQMNAPLVVAVGGTVAGAGLGLACAGDFVLAADDARFTIAYTRIGLSPDASSTWFLPRRVGLPRAKEMLLRNPLLDAPTALQWGLIDRVVPAAELETEAVALARELAAGPTLAFGAVKRLLLGSHDNDLHTQLELETNAICEIGAGEDAREGVRAFVEKRAARFCGVRK